MWHVRSALGATVSTARRAVTPLCCLLYMLVWLHLHAAGTHPQVSSLKTEAALDPHTQMQPAQPGPCAQIWRGRVYEYWDMYVWLQQTEGLRIFDMLLGPGGLGPPPPTTDFVCCAQFVVDRATIKR